MKCSKCGQEYEGNFCPNGCNSPAYINPPAAVPNTEKQGAPTWAIILLLFLFFPVGIALMWAKKSWPVWIKVLITVLFAGVVLVYAVAPEDGFPAKEPGTNTTLIEIPEQSDNSTALTESTPAAAKDRFSINETANLRTIRVTANEMKESLGSKYVNADDGKVFVGVKFTIENISDEEQSISTGLLFDAYADGIKQEYSISANMAFSEGTLSGTLSPGKKLVGWYAVEVPENWKELEFQVKSSWLSSTKATFVLKK